MEGLELLTNAPYSAWWPVPSVTVIVSVLMHLWAPLPVFKMTLKRRGICLQLSFDVDALSYGQMFPS